MGNFDTHFENWWYANQRHFSHQIENEELDDYAVKKIYMLDLAIEGVKWELDGIFVSTIHNLLKK